CQPAGPGCPVRQRREQGAESQSLAPGGGGKCQQQRVYQQQQQRACPQQVVGPPELGQPAKGEVDPRYPGAQRRRQQQQREAGDPGQTAQQVEDGTCRSE